MSVVKSLFGKIGKIFTSAPEASCGSSCGCGEKIMGENPKVAGIEETKSELGEKRRSLKEVELSDVTKVIRQKYVEHYPQDKKPGNYSAHDWKRVSYVSSHIKPSGKILDVGVGCGQIVNILAEMNKFDEIVGADIHKHSKYVEFSKGFSMKYFDVAEIPFPDNYFDSVLCMEVLEHIDRDHFVKAIAELRRVCRGDLFMSVPWQEPYPLYRAHLQRFDVDDIRKYFPQGDYTILDKETGVPWMLVRETPSENSSTVSSLEVGNY